MERIIYPHIMLHITPLLIMLMVQPPTPLWHITQNPHPLNVLLKHPVPEAVATDSNFYYQILMDMAVMEQVYKYVY